MCAQAAGAPGTAAARAPSSEACRRGLPSASRYMSAVAASGARSRPSIMTLLPSAARCSSQKPPPPMPEPYGSTTPRAALTATAASKALPPASRISRPAAVASGCAVTTAAAGGVPAVAAKATASSSDAVNERTVERMKGGMGSLECGCWSSSCARGNPAATGLGAQCPPGGRGQLHEVDRAQHMPAQELVAVTGIEQALDRPQGQGAAVDHFPGLALQQQGQQPGDLGGSEPPVRAGRHIAAVRNRRIVRIGSGDGLGVELLVEQLLCRQAGEKVEQLVIQIRRVNPQAPIQQPERRQRDFPPGAVEEVERADRIGPVGIAGQLAGDARQRQTARETLPQGRRQ